jgi:hypothetical protein
VGWPFVCELAVFGVGWPFVFELAVCLWVDRLFVGWPFVAGLVGWLFVAGFVGWPFVAGLAVHVPDPAGLCQHKSSFMLTITTFLKIMRMQPLPS